MKLRHREAGQVTAAASFPDKIIVQRAGYHHEGQEKKQKSVSALIPVIQASGRD